MSEACPLCHHPGALLQDEFHTCQNCAGIFRAAAFLPTPEAEKSRYETHNNDIHDPRYQQFVSPITQAVLAGFTKHHQGLDFGAGTGPVISYLLQKQGYDIQQYDPFFHPAPELLRATYDYIVCCEVIEHFQHPDKEFELLRKLLKPNGSLFCMTVVYEESIDFGSWYYKNDPTHVFFYRSETLRWIKNQFGFSSLQIENRLIQLDG
jgi:SAM-dependent methyltransferase